MTAALQTGASEFSYTQDDFAAIARILYDETGIHLPPGKSTLVYSRIAKRLRALHLESFRDYCALVSGGAGAEERSQMLTALTTNVTRFFREPHHFEHLKAKLLPPLLAAARAGQKIRIWSAGCSSGQEPYSIALTLLSLLPDARAHDIRILATDLTPHVIATGRRGLYPAAEVADVPADLRHTWMDEVRRDGESHYQMDDAVRGLVTFRELNLMGHWPMKGAFNAIFCRNVVIYFDEPTQIRMWGRMVPLLAPQACLYIGHSERLAGPAQARLRLEGTTTYRLLPGSTS